MRDTVIVMILSLGLMMTACSLTNYQDAESLDDVNWELIYINKLPPLEGVLVTAVFEDGYIGGSGGCNRYSGTYSVNGKRINVSPLINTLMACPIPQGIMEQEELILKWLMSAKSFDIRNEALEIYRIDGRALTFIRKEE
jgi:heat shock protein HslJ